jgi:DNA-directed RNA polymerase subunit D
MSADKTQLEVLKQEENYIEFKLTGSQPAIANALRRTILGDVPIMAIEDVVIYENTSPLFDEYITHRLALIPLTTDLKSYKMPSECCGGNCSSCSVTLSIDESGPKMVYSSALKTTDAQVKPVSGKIPIIELMEGQRLRLEAKAMLGKGEDHAKWQAGNASYKFLPTLEAKAELENAGEIAKECPKKALEAKNKKLSLERPADCTMCRLCVEKAGKDISLGQDRTSFVFKVETNGSITALEAIEKAIEIIHKKNKFLMEELENEGKK